MRVVSDGTRSNEELTLSNFPYTRHKVSTPVYKEPKVSINLGSARLTDIVEYLFSWGIVIAMVTACC